VDRVELILELLRRHVEMSIIHVQRTHSHQSEQLSTLLVAITRSVFRQPQRQIAITSWNRSEQLVMMRTVHRFEVVNIVTPHMLDYDGREAATLCEYIEAR